MATGRAGLEGRARRALACMLVVFALGQGALALVQLRKPALHDPEYGCRLAHFLQQRQGREDGPLVLVMGSSRVRYGFRPEAAAPCRTADGREAMVYNFGLTGAGPLQELVYFRRLLKAGVRPALLLLEYWPPLTGAHKGDSEMERVDVTRRDWADLAVLRRYADRPLKLYRDWGLMRLLPWFTSRFVLVNACAPGWLPAKLRWREDWHPDDRSGWSPFPTNATEEEHRYRLDGVRRNAPGEYWPDGCRAPSVTSRRAFRELLESCRAEGIPVAVFVLPEGPLIRSLYPPGFLEESLAHLGRLGEEFGVPVFDTRTWCGEEDFTDSFHLTPDGAGAFTARFVRDVLQPLLVGVGARASRPHRGEEAGGTPALRREEAGPTPALRQPPG